MPVSLIVVALRQPDEKGDAVQRIKRCPTNCHSLGRICTDRLSNDFYSTVKQQRG